MKRNGLVLLLAALVVLAGCAGRGESVRRMKARVFALAEAQLPAIDARLGEGEYARSLRPDGTAWNSNIDWWCSGFYPGSLWYVYRYGQDEGIRALAEKHTRRLAALRDRKADHDIGFQLNCSYGGAYAATGDEAWLEMVRVGADKLCERFNPVVGATRSWDNRSFPVIIDNMMNLEILLEAWRHTGEERYREIACTHARTTMKNHFRPDYSTWHLVDYDPETGAVLRKQTVQGYADDSMWARGEAWALYGYTMMARETGEEEFLAQARHIADLLLERLPEDGIPYWDFDCPDIPDTYRDASAGAIMAAALVRLARLTGEKRYRACALRQLRTLAGPAYLAEPGTNGGFLLKHSVGNLPSGSEVDVPLSYADYYFLEALYFL